jgi:transposase
VVAIQRGAAGSLTGCRDRWPGAVGGRVESEQGLADELALLRAQLAAKDERIDQLPVQVAELTTQVQALVLRLSKDSSTSSRPPSWDGPGKQPRGGSSRTRSGRKPGKQPGEPGTTLRQVEDPNERITIPAPAACTGCGTSLIRVPVGVVRRLQVFDPAELPPSRIIEYAADIKCCPGCGRKALGAFPAGVDSAAQYGPGLTAKVCACR